MFSRLYVNYVTELSNSLNEPEWVLDERLQALSSLDYFTEEDKSQKLGPRLSSLLERIKMHKGIKKEILEHENVGFLSLNELLEGNKSEFYKEIFFNRFNHSQRNPEIAFVNAFFNECMFYFVDDKKDSQISLQTNRGIFMNFFILGNDLKFTFINAASDSVLQSNEIYGGENCEIYSLIHQNSSEDSLVSQINHVNSFSSAHSYACWFGKGNGEIYTKLEGENSAGYDLEIFVSDDTGSLNLKSTLEHATRSTKGNIYIKGVVKENSRVKSDGMIKINKDAPLSESFLDQHIILLNDGAIAEANPELEIENNDVSSRHAATVSQIDEEKLFYLKSRGVDEEDAKNLIVDGFLNSAVKKIKNDYIREYTEEILGQKSGADSEKAI